MARETGPDGPAKHRPDREVRAARAKQDSVRRREVRPRTPGPLRVTTHRSLLLRRDEICKRFNERPDIARLLILNPALAFKEVGVELSPQMRDHVLRSMRLSPSAAKRLDELEASLRRQLREAPRPTDAEWLARTLFTKLKVKPLATAGLEPPYTPALDAATVARLQTLLPQPRTPIMASPPLGGGMTISVAATGNTISRIDIGAPVPRLQPARRAPKRLDLPTLFFYAESHPLVRDLLELGVLQASTIPVHTASRFRNAKTGVATPPVLAWVSAIRFPK